MPKLIKNPVWEEITQQAVIIIALICTANISVPWLQVGSIVGWGLCVLPLI